MKTTIMRKFLTLVLAAAFVTAAQLSEECKYVHDKYILNDVKAVKKCFETYQLDEAVLNTIIYNLDIIQEIYPYVEIASNPPSNPPGYFKAVNYSSALNELKNKFKQSNGEASIVVRAAMGFVNSFRDGHFTLSFGQSSSPLYENIFVPVYVLLPFNYDIVVDGAMRNVTLTPTGLTDSFTSDGSEILKSKKDAGVLATKIDGKDTFEFLTSYLGDYNNMKSKQGRAFLSLQYLNGFQYISAPFEDAFDDHTIEFSDGTTLNFTFGVLNINNQNNVRLRNEMLGKSKLFDDESNERDTEVLEAIKNIDNLMIQKRSEHDFYKCGLVNEMNFMTVSTFSPQSASWATVELLECIQQFDENEYPITVIFPFNNGGSTAMRELMQFLLMPTSDVRSLRAARKTPTTRYIYIDNKLLTVSNVSGDCEKYTDYESQQFWKEEDHDDFGNGALHTRTKKFFESFESQFDFVAKYRLQKHVRKPTDIILATDGYCFSSCAFFVDNNIRSGSAIVVGYGVTFPGDEQFVAGQCPSRVVNPSQFFDDLKQLNSLVGLEFRTTSLESFNISEKMNEIIPADYDILRIDKHCGYYKNIDPDTEELLNYTKAVHEEFKTKCNPANKRLFLVTDECSSNDPNALYVGHACGSNGEWDKKTCKISGCKPGYVVDFDNDKCVPNGCDPRRPEIPSSKPAEESAKPAMESSTTSLYPMLGAVATVFAIAFHNMN